MTFGPGGPQPQRTRTWQPGWDLPGWPFYGSGLAAGDLTGDGYDDLAIGATHILNPDERSKVVFGGRVHLLAGSPDGLAGPRTELAQGADGIPGTDENGDRFGGSVAILPGPPGSPGWLAIGVPYETLGDDAGTFGGEGMVVVVPGTPTGIDPDGTRIWHQDTPGITDTAEPGDAFGTLGTHGAGTGID